jgi:hypothetical protein
VILTFFKLRFLYLQACPFQKTVFEFMPRLVFSLEFSFIYPFCPTNYSVFKFTKQLIAVFLNIESVSFLAFTQPKSWDVRSGLHFQLCLKIDRN